MMIKYYFIYRPNDGQSKVTKEDMSFLYKLYEKKKQHTYIQLNTMTIFVPPRAIVLIINAHNKDTVKSRRKSHVLFNLVYVEIH